MNGLRQRLTHTVAPLAGALPPAIRRPIVVATWTIIDLLTRSSKKRLFGDQARLVPPLRLMNDGPKGYRAFKENGDEYIDILVRLCHLKPTDHVLDIGCGIGRKTLPLLRYLDPHLGRYEGMDPHRPHVEWCRETIQAAFPHFRFQHIDIWSKLYNPSGTIKAHEYLFPFADQSFDFVILGSVFTHMFLRDVRNYLSEIARVLRPGARGMISFFFLTPESEALVQQGRSSREIVYEVEPGCKADNPDRIETAIGHREDEVLRICRSHGLGTSIHYGSWCWRSRRRGRPPGWRGRRCVAGEPAHGWAGRLTGRLILTDRYSAALGEEERLQDGDAR